MREPDLRDLVPGATPVSGKHVLLSGGTTGIGRAVARVLVANGARVLLFGRHEQELASTLESLDGLPGEAHGLTADVSRIEDVRRVFDEVDRIFPALDILIDNAAITGEGFEGEPLETIDYVVRTNVFGYLACAREAVRRMEGRGRGHVVLVGSMSADLREPAGSTYVATKAAIQAFAESLRKTVNEAGIRVSLIEPGKVATDLVDMPEPEMEEAISAQKMLRPEDVAGSVLFTLLQPERCDVVGLQIRPHGQEI